LKQHVGCRYNLPQLRAPCNLCCSAPAALPSPLLTYRGRARRTGHKYDAFGFTLGGPSSSNALLNDVVCSVAPFRDASAATIRRAANAAVASRIVSVMSSRRHTHKLMEREGPMQYYRMPVVLQQSGCSLCRACQATTARRTRACMAA
jgi:hypothetical protein